MFVEPNQAALLTHFKQLLVEIKRPNSGIPTPSNIQILLKYFVVQFSTNIGDMQYAANLSNDLVNTDIMTYYGHMQSELSIEPMLIVLNHKFAFFMDQHFGAD